MCSFRYVTVTYPNGLVVKVIERIAEHGKVGCSMCGFGYTTLKKRGLPPHDGLGHLELYQGASVKRGRRLSAAEIERRGLVDFDQEAAVQARMEV